MSEANQPHWASMLGVPSTGLTQGFRYHFSTQRLVNGTFVRNFGSNKGLELIVGENAQIQVGVPAYVERERPGSISSGWSDESMLAKFRIASANEEEGNYVANFSLGLSLPTGSPGFSTKNTVFTPTLAAGKGWGTHESGFDIQSLVSLGVADRNNAVTGLPFIWNTGVQAHVSRHIWPEIEVAYTHWNRGWYSGRSQMVVTYGIAYERRIAQGKSITIGAGYQEPRGTAFSTFTRGWISMAKFSF
ncbi:MAG: hypothetical protein HKL98_05700 [Burkholderiales bacterium]|nr:hypothetical protein [Burkholderiales bacterium]